MGLVDSCVFLFISGKLSIY